MFFLRTFRQHSTNCSLFTYQLSVFSVVAETGYSRFENEAYNKNKFPFYWTRQVLIRWKIICHLTFYQRFTHIIAGTHSEIALFSRPLGPLFVYTVDVWECTYIGHFFRHFFSYFFGHIYDKFNFHCFSA